MSEIDPRALEAAIRVYDDEHAAEDHSVDAIKADFDAFRAGLRAYLDALSVQPAKLMAGAVAIGLRGRWKSGDGWGPWDAEFWTYIAPDELAKRRARYDVSDLLYAAPIPEPAPDAAVAVKDEESEP